MKEVKTSPCEIKITNKSAEVFKLYFKNILDLSDEEFQNLIEKLSDKNEFTDKVGQGVFYKNSTDKTPLTFKDMGLVDEITKYRETQQSSDDSLLSSYALFSSEGEIVGYASFYFYIPDEPKKSEYILDTSKPQHFLEPDYILFNEFRHKNISLSIITCLMVDVFKQIIDRGKLGEYRGLYATVHPQNSASRKIIENFGFDFKKISEDKKSKSMHIDFSKDPLESITKSGQLIATEAKNILEKLIKNLGDFFKNFTENKQTKISKDQETQTPSNDLIYDEIFSKNSLPEIQNAIEESQMLIEIQDNFKEKNRDLTKDTENFRLRLVATKEDNLLKLFGEMILILEKNTDYSTGINFLRNQLKKLPELDIKNNSAQLIKSNTKNEKLCQTHLTIPLKPDEEKASDGEPENLSKNPKNKKFEKLCQSDLAISQGSN